MIPKGLSRYIIPMLMLAAMDNEEVLPRYNEIEAKEPVKSHGGAGRNIHKEKNKKRKTK